MIVAERKTTNKHEEQLTEVHQWFWDGFTLSPPDKSEQAKEHSHKAPFWQDLLKTVHEWKKTTGANSGDLHKWFWKDFVLTPRKHAVHWHTLSQSVGHLCSGECTDPA